MSDVAGHLRAIHWNQVSTITLVTLLVLSGTVATLGVAPAAAVSPGGIGVQPAGGAGASNLGTLSSVDGAASLGSLTQTNDWPTTGHDPGRSGHSPDGTGPTTGPEARWIHESVVQPQDEPAVVANGLVYVPDRDGLRVLENDTGALVWNATDVPVEELSVADGVVVATAPDSVQAFDATTGAELWNLTTVDADGSAILDGVYYTNRETWSGQDLKAYDLSTGAELWSAGFDPESVTGGMSAADGTIYATGQVNDRDYAVYALNASDGSEEWRFEMEGELSMRPTALDGSVYVGAGDETYDPKFYRLNATDGHVEWIFDVNAQPLGAAVADGFVYLAAGNTVHALHEETGEREWLHRLAGNIEYGLHYHGMYARSPAVADGTVYAVNDRGFLVGLDGATGTEQWTYRLEGEGTAPAIADGRLYVHVIDTEDINTDYSRVYALEDSPLEFENFALSSTAVEPGESFTATVDVTNGDDESRDFDLSLMGDPQVPADWRALDRANGTLAPGESRELTFVGTVHSSGSWNVSLKRPLASDPAVDPVTVAVETPTDVDEWPFVGFDGGRTGDNPDTVGPMQHAQEVWNLTYFDDDARPVIANGSVFVVQEQTVYDPHRVIYTLAAYDEATGALEWEFNVSARDRAAAGSATVDGDTVYLFTRPMNFDDEGPAVHDNSLFALNHDNGSIEWSRDFTLNESLSHDQAPVVSDGQVYVAGGIPETEHDSDARLIAFDADTGATNWNQRIEADGENELFYHVTAADGTVVATLADEDYDSGTTSYDDRLVAFDTAGGQLWSTSGPYIDVQEPPVIRDGTVYAISETQQADGDPIEVLHAFDLSNGSERWSFSPPYRADEANGWRIDSPTVTDDAIFLSQRIDVPTSTSSNGHLYRLDAASGDVVWNRSTPLLGAQFAVGGLLYAGDAAEDYTFVYNAETGEKYTETDFFSRGQGSAQAVANGTMITYLDTTQPDEFRVIREGGIIEYTDLSVDSHKIGEYENVTVTATATNHGAYARNYNVKLDVAPDDYSDRHFWNTGNRYGTLAPGESTTITWTVRLDVRGDFVFFLVPLNDGDGNGDDDVVAMNLHKYDRAGSQTVHVGDADDGTVFDLGDPRDLAPDAASWPKESFDAGNTGNYTGTGAPTAVGDDVVTWVANHSSAWTSGPTVAENTIFAGGYDGGEEALYAFNATDGSLRWEYPTESDVEVAPTYAGGYLYTATSRDRVFQFDAATGERLWTYQGVEDVGGIAVVDDVAYVTGDVYVDDGYSGTLHALNATTREVLWTFTRPSSSYGMGVTPAVENGTVYVTNDNRHTYALNATTGDIEWSEPIAGSGSRLHSPVVEDGVVYVDDTAWDSTDANLYALDATDGDTIWSTPANVDGYTGSSPALADDTLFFTADSAVRAVDATDGDELWSTTICSATRHSPVHADGVVYVGTTDSAIRAYDADTGDLVWRYDGYGDYAFTPAVVDGMLYATGLENTDDVYSLIAMEGGPTDEPKTLFEYSNLFVSNEAVAVGESVTVSATVENLGDEDCDYAADLVIDESVEDTATGSLGDGWDETVEFTHSFASTGTYNVTVEDLPPVEVTVAAPSPGISADPSTVEYGDVDVGDTHGTIDVLIENDGTAPLEVSSRTITGPDAGDFEFSDAGPSSPIAPGDSSSVGVRFTPSHTGAHEATIELETNATADAFEIPLSGTGVTDPPAIQVTPASIDFGEVATGTTASETVTIENVGGSTLTFDNATLGTSELDSFEVVAGNATTALAPGETHDLTVEFVPPIVSADSTTLQVHSDDPDDPTVSVSLAGTGIVPAPVVQVDPTSIDFGTVVTGSNTSANVTVSNVGQADLSVTGLSIAGEDSDAFSVSTASPTFVLAPGESRNATVTFEPTAAETATGTLDIATNDTPTTVSIDLSGTGVEPPGAISVAPSSVEFGEVLVGENATETVVVSNEGAGPLTVTGADVLWGSAAYTVTNGSGPVELAPTDSHEITVTYEPTAIDPQSASLRIASDDPENGTVSVALNGSGYLEPGVHYGYQVESTTVDEGENVSMMVGVLNNQATADAFNATLKLDGAVYTHWNGTVAPNTDDPLFETFNLSLSPGEYELTVNDLEATIVTVSAADPDPPTSPGGGGSGDGSPPSSGTPPSDDPPSPPAPSIDVTALDGGGFGVHIANADGDGSLTARFPNGSLGTGSLSLDALGISLVGGTGGDLQVTAGSEVPAGTAPPDASVGEPLAYFDVAHPSLADGDVTGATFEFTVPHEVLTERGVAPDDVVLVRYHDGEWTALETRLVDETGETFVFGASSPGLSVFAVVASPSQPSDPGDGTGGKPADPDDGEEPTAPDSGEPGDQSDEADDETETDEASSGGSSGQPGFGPVAVLFALLAAVGLLSRRDRSDGTR